MYENVHFAHAKTKAQISFAVTAKLTSAFEFVHAPQIVQCLFFLYPKFPACSHLLRLHIVRILSDLVRNPKDQFSRVTAHMQTNQLTNYCSEIASLSLNYHSYISKGKSICLFNTCLQC